MADAVVVLCCDRVSPEQFATTAHSRAQVAAWFDHYNRERRHSACQMMSPINYELGSESNEEVA